MEAVLFAAALLGALTWKHRQVAEGIENFWNQFRGGPPPTHPSPANDAALLRRRR